MDLETELGVRVRLRFCRRFKVDATHSWLCQPFSVLGLVARGRFEVVFAESRLPRIEPAEGELFFLPAGLRRRPNLGGREVADILAAGIALEHLGGLDLLPRCGILSLPEPQSRLKTQLLALERWTATPDSDPLHRAVEREAMVHTLAAELVATRCPSESAPIPLPQDQRCLPAVRFMDECFAEPVDIAMLCELCHMSRTHFFRLFRQTLGCAPLEYLHQRRVRKARRLLAETHLTIAEIGSEVGWPDPFHFSRAFKAATGIAPSHYRTSWQNQRLV